MNRGRKRRVEGGGWGRDGGGRRILLSPIFPQRDHVVGTARVVVEGILRQHELRVALKLANVYGLPSF